MAETAGAQGTEGIRPGGLDRRGSCAPVWSGRFGSSFGGKMFKRRRARTLAGSGAGSEEMSDPERAPSPAPRRKATCKRAAATSSKDGPAAGKKRRTGDFLCARCGQSSGKADFHMIEAPGGAKTPSTACLRCWLPWHKCWKATYSWPELCAKIKEDPTIAKSFEKTAAIEAGEVLKDFAEQSVTGATVSGYRVVSHLALIEAKDLSSVVGSGLAPSAVNLRYDKVLDSAGNPIRGVLIRHPQKPWTDVEIFSEVRCSMDTLHLPAPSCLTSAQAGSTLKSEKRSMVQGWPVSLKNIMKAPTLDSLKAQFQAADRASGNGAGEESPADEAEGEEEEDKVEDPEEQGEDWGAEKHAGMGPPKTAAGSQKALDEPVDDSDPWGAVSRALAVVRTSRSLRGPLSQGSFHGCPRGVWPSSAHVLRRSESGKVMQRYAPPSAPAMALFVRLTQRLRGSDHSGLLAMVLPQSVVFGAALGVYAVALPLRHSQRYHLSFQVWPCCTSIAEGGFHTFRVLGLDSWCGLRRSLWTAPPELSGLLAPLCSPRRRAAPMSRRPTIVEELGEVAVSRVRRLLAPQAAMPHVARAPLAGQPRGAFPTTRCTMATTTMAGPRWLQAPRPDRSRSDAEAQGRNRHSPVWNHPLRRSEAQATT